MHRYHYRRNRNNPDETPISSSEEPNYSDIEEPLGNTRGGQTTEVKSKSSSTKTKRKHKKKKKT